MIESFCCTNYCRYQIEQNASHNKIREKYRANGQFENEIQYFIWPSLLFKQWTATINVYFKYSWNKCGYTRESRIVNNDFNFKLLFNNNSSRLVRSLKSIFVTFFCIIVLKFFLNKHINPFNTSYQWWKF